MDATDDVHEPFENAKPDGQTQAPEEAEKVANRSTHTHESLRLTPERVASEHNAQSYAGVM